MKNHEEKLSIRLLQIEKRFAKDIAYKKLYQEFMQGYIDINHIELIQEKSEENIYYKSHNCVIKPDSTSTKLRMVLDASSNTTTGVSLNDIMMNDPKLKKNLSDWMEKTQNHHDSRIYNKCPLERAFRTH